MKDGRHQTYPYFGFGVGHTEGVNQGMVVGHEVVAMLRPVAWVGIVEAKVDYHHVGFEGQGVFELGQLHVGVMPFVEQRGATVPKVAHIVAVDQHLLQAHRVGLRFTVGQFVAKCHTVAHTGHLDGRAAEQR